ncbi:MAG: hypothetical protein BWX60_00193 [Candidatus Marinimicrobia bacterium ADurb.Bin030]|nr:MAG: hypothetical protein BWX60_00193 [Candidatus Marinimicrobia bacterium ADurb.Bin030]
MTCPGWAGKLLKLIRRASRNYTRLCRSAPSAIRWRMISYELKLIRMERWKYLPKKPVNFSRKWLIFKMKLIWDDSVLRIKPRLIFPLLQKSSILKSNCFIILLKPPPIKSNIFGKFQKCSIGKIRVAVPGMRQSKLVK